MATNGPIDANDLISPEAIAALADLRRKLSEAQSELVALIQAGKGTDTAIQNATKISKLTSTINSLTVSVAKLTAANQRLINAQNQINVATQRNANAMSRVTTATNGATVAHGRMHTMLSNGLNALKQYALAYLTIVGAVQLFKKVLRDTTALDSMNFTLRTVIKSTFELAQTHVYLRGIIQRYGTDLADTTNSYVRFRAAISNSSMTTKQGQQVFESFAKATAVLGMSQEKTNDVFLALEQMLSKGSIMTEELRRQMGQHLPVALHAMAMAAKDAGISTSGTVEELMKLMKAAKVNSEIVLPYFAKRVEEDLGIKSVDSVDTLAAAQERVSIAWMNFIRSLSASSTFTKAFNNIAELTNRIANIFKPTKLKVQDFSDNVISWANEKINSIPGVDKKSGRTEDIVKAEKQAIVDSVTKQIEASMAKEQRLLDTQGDTKLSKLTDDPINRFIRSLLVRNKEPEDKLKTSEKIAGYDQALKTLKDNAQTIISPDKNIVRASEEEDEKIFNNALAIFKDKQTEELAIFTDAQEKKRLVSFNSLSEGVKNEAKLRDIDADTQRVMENNIFKFKETQGEELIKFTKGHNKALADAKKELAQLEAGETHKLTEFEISERKRVLAEEIKIMEEDKRIALAMIEEKVNGIILENERTATGKWNSTRNPWEHEQITSALNVDNLNAARNGVLEMLNIANLETNEKKRLAEELANLEKALEEEKRKETEKTYQHDIALRTQAMQYTQQALNGTFSLFESFNDAKMQSIEEAHTQEVNLAGDNVAAKLAAENKYVQEKNKLQRRQAILEKVQAATNVILNTAMAVMATLGETGIFGIPLVPVILGIGALELAAVMAQPIPNYEFGGEHKGGLARFSEKGQELFIPKSGGAFLTPVSETIAEMPEGIFYPSGETQRILSQMAMNNFSNESNISLSSTNSILRTIADKSDTTYSNGYKIISNRNLIGRYVTRS